MHCNSSMVTKMLLTSVAAVTEAVAQEFYYNTKFTIKNGSAITTVVTISCST